MSKFSPFHLVLLLIPAVSAVVGLLAAFRLGLLDGSAAAIIGAFFLAALFGLFLFFSRRKLRQRELLLRQVRFAADRFQALLKALPGGYCLFSPQGLLREEYGVASRLNLRKLVQFEDLAAGIAEGPALSAAYLNLQQNGEDFDLNVTAPGGGQTCFHVTGRRFSIGKEGPKVDLLWFSDRLSASGAKAANEKQKAAEDTGFHTILDALPFPVWVRKENLDILLCNAAFCKAVDATPADVLEKQPELMSQTARGGTGRGLAANVLKRKEKLSERRHVILGGKRRLLEITEMPFHLDAEKEGAGPAVLLGFAVDVTAEEEKETELQRHLAAHHEVMEHLGSAIAVYGRDMRLEFHNSAYQKLWEADESFLNGKPTFAEVLEDLRARRRLPEQVDFQQYKKGQIALFTSLLEPHEDQMFLPDGTTLRILAVPHPFGGIMFVHENVTDRLALESSYNTLMEVQRETLDNLAEGIAVFGSDGKLQLSNPSFARIWNIDQDALAKEPHVTEILERMKPLLNTGEDWDAFKSGMVSYALDRHPRKERLQRTDQSVIDYQTVPLPDGAVLNSYLDVSDSVRIEQALRASNAALSAADRLKSDFVANVSYQLRTPLNTIAGFADILTEQYFGTLNDKQLEYARTIKAETEKLSRLINDVLDLALLEAGRMALDRKALSAADILNAAKQMTAEWARQQKLEMIIDCPAGLEPFEADEHRLKQILFNLISNSIKYTPEGGRITLEARREDKWMVLSVVDTGIGIPEADRGRVFGKFERTQLPHGGGAGLGLSLVKSLVELHGGRVEIASNAKNGTRISCFLPQKASEEDVAG